METQRRILSVADSARTWNGVKEAVPGMNNLTFFVDSSARVPEVEARLRDQWAHATPMPASPDIVEIPVHYGGPFGPDLSDVAAACACGETEVVSLHCGREYIAYFLGFAPGFAYLGDVDERLRLPRRAQPRVEVPAGSVAIAEHMTGIYPARSPGGWHVIGWTPLTVFDIKRDPPALISAGDRVRFINAGSR